MEQNFYSYIISPETIRNKYKDVTFLYDPFIVTGTSRVCCSSSDITATTQYLTGTTRIQMSMKDILSGGTNGVSLLTGLTIPILFTQTDVELGFYTPFDGNINQLDDLNNFIFSSTTNNPYTYYIYNTSDINQKKFLGQVNWTIDWGDGTSATTSSFSPNFITKTYPNAISAYTITLKQNSPWGLYEVKKEVRTPFTNAVINNPKGTVNFYPQGGLWDNVRNPYDFIFTGDSENNIQSQLSSNFTTVPFLITGFTKSRLNELSSYGPIKYVLGPKFKVSGSTIKNGLKVANLVQYASIDQIGNDRIEYTIDGVRYVDFSGSPTFFYVESSGITSEMISSSPITKDETLLKIIDKPQVWSDVFIERGKNTAMEFIQRLGEVDNLGDLQKYGYRFFNVKS